MSRLSSAKGLLALLQEEDTSVIQFALSRLNGVVDEFWHEITADLALIEELYESVNLPQDVRCQAALIASRVFFHLGEYDDSVHFALHAGKLFDSNKRSLYNDTILGQCIDMYVADRENPNPEKPIDPRLEKLFNSLAENWETTDDNFLNIKELLGFTIRARRLDLLEKALSKHVNATKSAEMLTFTLNSANIHINDIAFRRDVLRALTKMYSESLSSVDYFALTKCLIFLGDSSAMAKTIADLLNKKQQLIAYQIAFDLFDHSNQEYIQSVADELAKSMATPAAAEGEAPAETAPALDPNVMEIMTGKVATSYYVKFLYSKCSADIHVLNHTKKCLDPKNSITHTATIISNALMYSGTTIDGFLRDNMEWLGKSAHWAKFTTTATVGAIHRGHIEEAMNILKPYLPTDNNVGPAPFQEAGALYALGLINNPIGVGSSKDTVDYLRNALRTYSSSEQIVHGASLGLGLAAMGLGDEDLFDALFACASGCGAVAGEGASVAIGMVMMGSGNSRIVEMLKNHASAYDQKEKTIRGLAMAIALIMMGKEGDADATIKEMLAHADHWVRVGGCFTLGLAYAGTCNTKAIERLLDVSVSDVSDEVRRVAVTMVGFLTFKDVDLCIEMTRILVDSYNSHIRYGVAMALGVSGAGTGNKQIIELLWGLKDDGVDFVRQGAVLALSLVMIQMTEQENEKVKEFRDFLKKTISDKKADTCTKFGCILATGIIDGGGRNCTISLHRDRHMMTKSVVGVFMFCQYWFWFPYTLMLTMAFQPTCVIGLNEQLVMPKYTIKSDAPPSKYALPKSVQEEKKEAKASGAKKALLSTTKKELEFRHKKKMAREGSVAMDLEEAVKESEKKDGAEGEGAAAESAEAAKEKEEPNFEILENPARVTLRQLQVIRHDHDSRYTPLKPNPIGLCMLKDLKPGEEVELVDKINPMDREDDVQPPEAFEWP